MRRISSSAGRCLFVAAVGVLTLTSSAAAAPLQTRVRLVVKVGTNRTYTRTELHPGATVVCRYQAHTLTVTAPTDGSEGSGAVWPLPGTNDRGLFHLNVNIAPATGYVVVCGLGGVHSVPVVMP
jgi:hypothetical protein